LVALKMKGETADELIGFARDLVLVNAAAALVASDRAESWKAGVAMAAQSIDSGAARAALEALKAF
jgi:anthranilate phosphoribosyltransferase